MYQCHRFVSLLLFLFLSFCFAQSSFAETSKAKAKRYFKVGNEAYQKGQYPQALDALEKAYQNFPLPVMLLNIADTYAKMGQYPQALERYASFVRTGQDQDGVGARKLKALEKKISTWVPVRITSQPSGAQVYIDHLDYPAWGTTPFTTQLPPQKALTLTFKKTGYEHLKKTQTLVSQPNSTSPQVISSQLQGKPAYVSILGMPKNLKVKVKGKEYRGLPQTQNLGVGQYVLEFYAPNHLPEKRTITLTSLHTQTAPLTLEVALKSSKGLGLLTLKVDQKEVLTLIDGHPAGETPMIDPLELIEGQHTIELRGKKGQQHRQSFMITKGKTTHLEIKLDESPFLTQSRVGVSLLVLSGSMLVGSLVSGGLAWSSTGDLDECRTTFQCHRKQGELNLAQEIRGYTQAADWLLGSGIILGSIGAYLYFSQSSNSSTPQVKVTPIPGGAAFFGTF